MGSPEKKAGKEIRKLLNLKLHDLNFLVIA